MRINIIKRWNACCTIWLHSHVFWNALAILEKGYSGGLVKIPSYSSYSSIGIIKGKEPKKEKLSPRRNASRFHFGLHEQEIVQHDHLPVKQQVFKVVVRVKNNEQFINEMDEFQP